MHFPEGLENTPFKITGNRWIEHINVLLRQTIEMLHDQGVLVGNHLLPLIFQAKVGINFLLVFDMFKALLYFG
jgi:hypothetical protein